jgi:PAS domain S-box-containing protein/putative nucleotidyltransferase with HDIG domain
MKLTPKLAFVFVLFAAAVLLGVNALGLKRGQDALRASTIHELEAIAGEKEAALEGWFAERQVTVESFANSPSFQSDVDTYIKFGPAAKYPYERLFRELEAHTGAGQPFLNLYILSAEEGDVLISVDPGEKGMGEVERPYFALGERGPYTTPIYYSPELHRPAMATLAPIYSRYDVFLGVLVGRLNLDGLNTIIQRRSGLRETDDAFLVNASGMAITQPRFLPQGVVIEQTIETVSVTLCMQGKNGTVFGSDYQNFPVIASYRWLPVQQMCLIVKISQAEALAPILDFRNNMIWIVLVVLVVASLVAFALARTIVRPILSMQNAAQRYSRGELHVRLAETRRDELGMLAHAFNQMAECLVQKELELGEQARTLELKVQERTQALQESHNQLQRAEEIGQVGSWELYIPENRVVASEGMAKLLGLPIEEFGSTLDAYFARVHPDDVARMQEILACALQKPGAVDAELRFIRPDGQILRLYARGESFFDEHGRPIRLTGVVIDITRRKQTEMQLKDALEFTEHILTSSPVGIFTYRLSGECVSVNVAAAQMVGATMEQLKAQNFHHIDSWKPAGLYKMARNTINTGKPTQGDVHMLTTFGRESWYSAHFVLFQSGGEDLLLMMLCDISERKHAEAALEAGEKRFRTWIENSSDLITLVDLQGVVQYQSPSVQSLLGYNQEEVLGKGAFDLLHPDDVEAMGAYFTETIQNPGSGGSAQCRIRHKDGTWRFMEARGQIYTDEHGEVVALINSRDITERKEAEENLRESEDRYRDLVEHIRDLIGTHDLDGRILSINPAATDLLGFDMVTLLSMNMRDLIAPEVRSGFDDYIAAIQRDGHASGLMLLQTRDGEKRFWEYDNTLRTDSVNGPIVRALARDVTERRQAEKALREKDLLLSEAQRIGRIGSWSYDIRDDLLTFSDEMYRLLDVLPDEFQHNKSEFLALVYPSDRARATQWMSDIKTGTQTKDLNFRLFHKNGELCYLHCTGVLEFDARGKPARFIGTAQDVTERRAAEIQIDQHIKRLTALSEIDRAIISSIDQRHTLDVILSNAISQLQVDAADILLFDPDIQAFRCAAGQGFSTKITERRPLTMSEGPAGRAARERRMIRIPDLREMTHDLSFSQLVTAEGFVSYIAMPLEVKGQVKGVLEVFQRSLLQPYNEWLDFFNTLVGQTVIAIENTSLFENLQHSNRELMQAYDATIEGWSRAMDLRDRETAGHTQRVTKLTLELARALGMDDLQLVHIRRGALLHDIGKLGVPDQILFKPGPLTAEERVMIEQHVEFAYEMLAPIPYLKPALNIPYFHHEKWDGTGYPLGLKGEQIPLEARIFALVDVWDALLSDRPYRMAWTRERTIEYVCAQSGIHFDPRVVECFLEIEKEMEVRETPGIT